MLNGHCVFTYGAIWPIFNEYASFSYPPFHYPFPLWQEVAGKHESVFQFAATSTQIYQWIGHYSSCYDCLQLPLPIPCYLITSPLPLQLAQSPSQLLHSPCVHALFDIHPREGSQNVQDALCSSIHAPHTLGDQDNITITDTAATFLGSVFRIGVNNFRTIAILHTSLFSTASDTCGRGAHMPLKFDGKQILQLPLEVPFFFAYMVSNKICYLFSVDYVFTFRP